MYTTLHYLHMNHYLITIITSIGSSKGHHRNGTVLALQERDELHKISQSLLRREVGQMGGAVETVGSKREGLSIVTMFGEHHHGRVLWGSGPHEPLHVTHTHNRPFAADSMNMRMHTHEHAHAHAAHTKTHTHTHTHNSANKGIYIIKTQE